MVEQKLMCPACRKDSSFEEIGLSWRDLQGLTWLLCDECNLEKKLKTRIACT